MASTTTQLIQTIDPTFPVSGQDNDSEGFRNNFNIIQSALLNINTATEALQAQLTALAGNTVNVEAPYVTGTHVVAKVDLKIGGTNVITTGGNLSTVISAGGGAGSVVLSVSTLTSTIVGAGDRSPGNSRFDYIFLGSSFGILSNATFAVNGNTYVVNNIDYTGNTCTTTPNVLIADYESITATTPVTFTNPFIPGQVSIDGFLNQRLSGGSNVSAGIVTATSIVVGSTGIKFSNGTIQTKAAYSPKVTYYSHTMNIGDAINLPSTNIISISGYVVAGFYNNAGGLGDINVFDGLLGAGNKLASWRAGMPDGNDGGSGNNYHFPVTVDISSDVKSISFTRVSGSSNPVTFYIVSYTALDV